MTFFDLQEEVSLGTLISVCRCDILIVGLEDIQAKHKLIAFDSLCKVPECRLTPGRQVICFVSSPIHKSESKNGPER